jgi:hypothetical protein
MTSCIACGCLQVAPIDDEDLGGLGGDGIDRALLAVERAELAERLADRDEIQHDLLGGRPRQLDPPRRQHHQTIAGITLLVGGLALGERPELALGHQHVERGLGKAAQEGIALQESADACAIR